MVFASPVDAEAIAELLWFPFRSVLKNYPAREKGYAQVFLAAEHLSSNLYALFVAEKQRSVGGPVHKQRPKFEYVFEVSRQNVDLADGFGTGAADAEAR